MTDLARSEAASEACSQAPALFAARAAWVTGGTSGIGRATAALLAALAADVPAARLGAYRGVTDPGVQSRALDVTEDPPAWRRSAASDASTSSSTPRASPTGVKLLRPRRRASMEGGYLCV